MDDQQMGHFHFNISPQLVILLTNSSKLLGGEIINYLAFHPSKKVQICAKYTTKQYPWTQAVV